MCGPKLLLLDEPSVGLAPVVVRRSSSWCGASAREGYTVLIVEQNVRQVLKVVTAPTCSKSAASSERAAREELAASDEIRKAYMGL